VTEERKGEAFILGETVLWSLFPIVTLLTFSGIPPLVSLTWTTAISTLFFFAVMLAKGTWRELVNTVAWRHAAMIALFIGVGFYGLFYLGLQYTTPGNAAILALCESLTTYIFFNLLRKEQFPLEHIFGAFFMLVGGIIVVGKDFSNLALGDFLILAAVFVSPIGNLYQKKCRELVSSETVMFMRSILSTVAMGALLVVFGQSLAISAEANSWLFLLLNGIVIFGISKIFWIEGIHRIAITKAILLQCITPLFTLLFAWWLLGQFPTVWQVTSLIPFILGVVLLTGNFRVTQFRNPFGFR
jgi:drug/metabolite transporter (DMT)-like permease